MPLSNGFTAILTMPPLSISRKFSSLRYSQSSVFPPRLFRPQLRVHVPFPPLPRFPTSHASSRHSSHLCVLPFFATRGYDLLIAIHPDAQDTMTQYAHQDRIESLPFRTVDRAYVRNDLMRTAAFLHCRSHLYRPPSCRISIFGNFFHPPLTYHCSATSWLSCVPVRAWAPHRF
jgi:hypothetical protein